MCDKLQSQHVTMNLFHIFQYGLVGAFVLLLGTFLSVMVSESVAGYVPPLFGLDAKNETLKFLGIGMGGVLLALQALMSYRRAKALEDTVRLTEGGQWQERLKNAVEHLGSDSDLLRMAGRYELYHLAQYTEESHLRQIVLGILGDYIRRKTSEEG